MFDGGHNQIRRHLRMAKFLIAKSKHIRTKGWHLDNLMKLDSQNVENAGVWGDDPGNDPGPLYNKRCK